LKKVMKITLEMISRQLQKKLQNMYLTREINMSDSLFSKESKMSARTFLEFLMSLEEQYGIRFSEDELLQRTIVIPNVLATLIHARLQERRVEVDGAESRG